METARSSVKLLLSACRKSPVKAGLFRQVGLPRKVTPGQSFLVYEKGRGRRVKRKETVIIFTVIALLAVFIPLNIKKLAEQKKQLQSPNGSPSQAMDADFEIQTEDVSSGSNSKQIYQLGESCKRKGVLYTVNSVKRYSSFPAFAEKEKAITTEAPAGSSFVCVDFTAENISGGALNKNIFSMAPIFIISDLAQDPNGLFASDSDMSLAYFSAAQNSPKKHDYTDFELEKDEKKSIQVLYYVKNELLDKLKDGSNTKMYVSIDSSDVNGFYVNEPYKTFLAREKLFEVKSLE
jgi:hypothetical protein